MSNLVRKDVVTLIAGVVISFLIGMVIFQMSHPAADPIPTQIPTPTLTDAPRPTQTFTPLPIPSERPTGTFTVLPVLGQNLPANPRSSAGGPAGSHSEVLLGSALPGRIIS